MSKGERSRQRRSNQEMLSRKGSSLGIEMSTSGAPVVRIALSYDGALRAPSEQGQPLPRNRGRGRKVSLSSDAAGLLEGADAGLEVEAAAVRVVLLGVPER